jgi:flagellar biosynthesis/type III secretory pathway protein FliH
MDYKCIEKQREICVIRERKVVFQSSFKLLLTEDFRSDIQRGQSRKIRLKEGGSYEKAFEKEFKETVQEDFEENAEKTTQKTFEKGYKEGIEKTCQKAYKKTFSKTI